MMPNENKTPPEGGGAQLSFIREEQRANYMHRYDDAPMTGDGNGAYRPALPRAIFKSAIRLFL
jgi:hypothetical protein